ncbi:hypothetical protein BH11BAC3_BH11BAC3_02590 [soil metagenome]
MNHHTKYSADFYEGGIFHVYNRTNNKELLFKSDENYSYFLRQYEKYLHPFLDTYCWNLLPNHFHMLVKVKPANEIKKHLDAQPAKMLKKIEKEFLSDKVTISVLMEQEWKRLFNSYSMAFNNQHNRKGNLFNRPFKRVEVEKDTHFTQAVVYIHANAQRHKLYSDFTKHKWSSWHSMLSASPTKLKRAELLDWFGGLDNFIKVHKEMTSYYYDPDIEIEE